MSDVRVIRADVLGAGVMGQAHVRLHACSANGSHLTPAGAALQNGGGPAARPDVLATVTNGS